MRRVTFTCVLILFATGLYQGVRAMKPTMITPSKEEHRIAEGEQLIIECELKGELIFSTQKLEGNMNQSQFSVYIDHRTGYDVFIRDHTITADTGWYACAERGTDIRNDERTIDHPSEDIAWTYVYVESSSKPFAVSHYGVIIIATVGDSVIIPCRPTSPDLEVILFANGNMRQLSSSLTYDPRLGFQLKSVDQDDSGLYECGIQGNEDGSDVEYPWFTFEVLEPNTELPNPVINKEASRDVVCGKHIALTCSIDVPSGSQLMLNWTAPSSVPKSRLREVVTESIGPKGEGTIQTNNLTVFNVTKTDGGEYFCTAVNQISRETTKDSTNVQIRDSSASYIDVSSDNDMYLIRSNEGIPVQWKMKIKAFPADELKWQWFDPSGHKILDSETDNRGTYSHTKNGFDHFFKISPVNVNDNGAYNIDFSTGNSTKSLTLKLEVIGRPQPRIVKDTSTNEPGQNATFTCIAKGLPLPNITWSYIEYPNFSSTIDVSPIKNTNENPYTVISKTQVMVKVEGTLTCTSCNEHKCTNATYQTSTTGNDFVISGPLSVAEGDNVTLTCRVSLDHFGKNLTWQSQRLEDTTVKHGIQKIVDGGNKKSVSILTLLDVKLADRGNYSCLAHHRKNGTLTKNHTLDVVEASVPRITGNTNMNGSKIFVKSNQSIILACVAEGAPNPEITWYKNNDRLVKSPQYFFTNRNSVLEIQFFHHTDSGEYLCLAKNRLDEARLSTEIVVEGSLQSGIVTLISLICALIVIIVVIITYMAFKIRREKRLTKRLMNAGLTHFEDVAIESLNPDLTVDDQAELLPYDKKWEFPRENLKLGKQLGSGAFGVVMKAKAQGICVEGEVTTVAVKMVRRTAEPSYMKALASELKIMIHLGRHINVVNLLGACTKTILTKRELYVIVEYCHFGNLHHYLQRHRNSFIDQIDPLTKQIDPNIGLELINARTSIISQSGALSIPTSPSSKSSFSNSGVEQIDYQGVNMSPDGGALSNNSSQSGWRSNYRGDYKDQNLKPICTQDLLCWAWQVSCGMEYLSSRNVLHGDLAARNILLAEDNVVKICDFGLAKSMYKDQNYKKQGDSPLPIKWMAIESIRDQIFSTQSDVWSFGIVLWEFFTLARTPYAGMEAGRLYEKLVEGHRMEKPEYATDEIYNFMLDCWQADPTTRPSFPELAEKIGTLLNERVKTRYFDLNTPYVNMNAVALQNGQNDYLMMSSPNHVYCNTTNPNIDLVPGYVPMNRLTKSTEAGPFTPSSEFKETHFEFFPNNEKTDADSDSENCTVSSPMLADDIVHLKPINANQVNDRNSGQIDENSADEKLQTAKHDDHVIDIPQENKKRPVIDDPTIDSFANPSYVILSQNRI